MSELDSVREWRNWQTRKTQDSAPAAYTNLRTHTQDYSRFIKKAGSMVFNSAQVCSFLLIARL
jgi:hypothetical protein